MTERRICPICEEEMDAPECPRDAFPTFPADTYTRQLATDLIGRLFEERYQIERKIGEGGMGTVYAAQQKPINRSVAIKCLNPKAFAARKARSRFVKEARILSELVHPNTVRIYDFGISREGVLFLVQELLEGESLQQLLNREDRLSLSRTIRISVQALGALEEAHRRGIIHRDIKPDNVFLRLQPGQADSVKVLDFGIARRQKRSENTLLTTEGSFIGTPPYAAPEQIDGTPLDPRSDLFSMGSLIYTMLTGRLAFAGKTALACLTRVLSSPPHPIPEEIADRLGGEVIAFLDKALQKDRAQRFGTAREMAGALAKIRSTVRDTNPVEIDTISLTDDDMPAEGRTVEPVEEAVGEHGGPPRGGELDSEDSEYSLEDLEAPPVYTTTSAASRPSYLDSIGWALDRRNLMVRALLLSVALIIGGWFALQALFDGGHPTALGDDPEVQTTPGDERSAATESFDVLPDPGPATDTSRSGETVATTDPDVKGVTDAQALLDVGTRREPKPRHDQPSKQASKEQPKPKPKARPESRNRARPKRPKKLSCACSSWEQCLSQGQFFEKKRQYPLATACYDKSLGLAPKGTSARSRIEKRLKYVRSRK